CSDVDGQLSRKSNVASGRLLPANRWCALFESSWTQHCDKTLASAHGRTNVGCLVPFNFHRKLHRRFNDPTLCGKRSICVDEGLRHIRGNHFVGCGAPRGVDAIYKENDSESGLSINHSETIAIPNRPEKMKGFT